jgi:hypothetical protein
VNLPPDSPLPPVDQKLVLLQQRRTSVLDFVLDQLKDVRGRIGVLDRQNLDYYESAVRDLENALGDLVGVLVAAIVVLAYLVLAK